MIILFLSLFTFVGGAQDKDSLWHDAVNGYSGGNYEVALRSFEELHTLGYTSPELYYNIANCYYKIGGHLGKAILNYERALLLNPSFEDAQVNLSIAKEYTLDKIDTIPEFVLVTYIKDIMQSGTANFWAILSLLFFAATVLLLLSFRFGSSTGVRKWSFAIALITLLLGLSTFGFAMKLNKLQTGKDQAVVMVPVTSVKHSPSISEQSYFILHEGTKVSVVDELGEWSRIELSDGRNGWINNSDIEKI